jgi:uncharacterized damage-inducible protein DinB
MPQDTRPPLGRSALTSLLEHLQAMARNNAWANFRLLQACSQLPEEAYRARRTSFSRRST